MKVLYLGPTSPLIEWLRSQGENVTATERKLHDYPYVLSDYDFVISYGYRHILKEDFINLFPNRIINLHISYLPFNRGCNPNLWSWIDITPKGVTIHKIDSGIDTGDILLRKIVSMDDNETLKTSYYKLQDAIKILFVDQWQHLKKGYIEGKKQGKGTYHSKADFEKIKHLLTNGWDTTIKDLRKNLLAHELKEMGIDGSEGHAF